MKVGIIGSSGFIGRYLCDLIVSHSEDTIVVWNRKSHGSFLSKENRETFLDSNRFDLLYQLAWTSIENKNYRQNLQNKLFAEATLELARSCISRGLHTVIVGTASSNISNKKDEYLESKEILRSAILKLDTFLVTLVRPTFVFSFEERRPHLFRTFMEWVEEGNQVNDFPINFPNREIDFIHVRDVATSLYYFTRQSACHSEVIIASGLSVSVSDAIHTLHQHFTGSFDGIIPVSYSPTLFDPKVTTSIFNQYTRKFFGLS